jgi:twitching motility protein PilU
MEKSTNLGMQTFDQALYDLYKAGRITLDEALRNADSQNNLRLKISLSEGKTDVNPDLKIAENPDDNASVIGSRTSGVKLSMEPK